VAPVDRDRPDSYQDVSEADAIVELARKPIDLIRRRSYAYISAENTVQPPNAEPFVTVLGVAMKHSSNGGRVRVSDQRLGKLDALIKRSRGTARNAGKHALGPISLLAGRQLLTKKATTTLVQSWAHPSGRQDVASLNVLEAAAKVRIGRSGVVTVGHRVLDVDYDNRSVLLRGTNLRTVNVDRAFAVWSHLWTNYYHWVVDILPKICAYQQAFGKDLADGYICYPFFGTPYEDESRELLGIPRTRFIDTRRVSPIAVREEIVVSVLTGWDLPHPATSMVRNRLAPLAEVSGPPRIYVARSSRRSVVNQEDVIALARAHGFTVIEDRPRSVIEQISLFRSAEVILAPHGAALANLTWCSPGTRVIELLPRGYHPPVFRNLCAELDLIYTSVKDSDVRGRGHWTQVASDFVVDLQGLGDAFDRVNL